MAKVFNKSTATTAEIMQMPKGLSVQEPYPLDINSYFDTLAAAEDYAKTGSTSYVGQVLTVTEAANAGLYMVQSDGTLKRLSFAADVAAEVATLTSGLADVGFQGTLTDMLGKSELKKGQMYVVDSAALATLVECNLATATRTDDNSIPLTVQLPKGTHLERNDVLIVTADCDYSGTSVLATLKTSESGRGWPAFVVIEKNLTGAMTTVDGGDAEADKFVTALANEDGTLKVTKSTLVLPTTFQDVFTLTPSLISDGVLPLSRVPKGKDGSKAVVTLNGVQLVPGADYTISAGKVGFTAEAEAELVAGDVVVATYTAYD